MGSFDVRADMRQPASIAVLVVTFAASCWC